MAGAAATLVTFPGTVIKYLRGKNGETVWGQHQGRPGWAVKVAGGFYRVDLFVSE